MKFNKIKDLLKNKYSTTEIRKAIKKIKPLDMKKVILNKKSIIDIIKSKFALTKEQ
jgi:hypothetical protein